MPTSQTARRRRHGRCRFTTWGAILTWLDSWWWKAPRLSGKRCPSRGGAGTRALVDSLRTKGASSPADEGSATVSVRGARDAQMRRGIFAPSRSAAAGGNEGKVLCSERLGPCSPALSSNGYRRKRWSGRGVARKRRRDWAVVSGVVILRCVLQRRRPASEGLSRLVALAILLREGKVAAPVKGNGRSEGGLGLNCATKTRRLEATRESGARGCVHASEVKLQKSIGGSRAQRSACRRPAKKSRSVTMRGDGSLARGNPGQSESNAQGAAGERAPRAGSLRKPHVTVTETGSDSRVCASVPYRGKASQVAKVVPSSRRGDGSDLGNPG